MHTQRSIYVLLRFCFVMLWLFFIVLWLYAGTIKLIDHKFFVHQLEMSPLFAPVAVLVSYTFPVIEFATTLLLIFNRTIRIGLYMTLLLFASLSLYIIYLFILAPKVPCACGGIIEKLNWMGHLILNISGVASAVISIQLNRYFLKHNKPEKLPLYNTSPL